MNIVGNYLKKFLIIVLPMVLVSIIAILSLFDASFKDILEVRLAEDVYVNTVSFTSISKDITLQIDAKSLRIVNKDEFKFEEISARIPGEAYEEIKIKSNFADYNASSQVVKLFSDVSINYGDKTLKSDLVYYDRNQSMVIIPSDFTLESDDLNMHGKNLMLDLKNKRLIVKEHTTSIKGN